MSAFSSAGLENLVLSHVKKETFAQQHEEEAGAGATALAVKTLGVFGISATEVMWPAIAHAATVAGEARYTSPLPCLPAKFRFPVLIVT